MAESIVPDAFYRSDHPALAQIASAATLKRWRVEGIGPPFSKLAAGRPGRIVYRGADLIAWIEARRVTPEAA